MSFFSFFKTRFGEFKSRLTHVGEREPLSKLSFVVILMLDVFVLVVIFWWLSDTTRQLTTPDDYITYGCQNYILDANMKTEENKIELTSNTALGYNDYNAFPAATDILETTAEKKLHPICLELNNRLEIAEQSTDLRALFDERNGLQAKENNLQSELNQIKGNYDTSLLEKIANMPSSADEMQQTRKEKAQEILDFQKQVREVEERIKARIEYQNIWGYILDNEAANQIQLEHDLQIARFWFPVKRLWMEFLFLIPLLLVIYFWNSRSVKKDNGVQMLITSHLLVVIAIPVLWKILEMLLEIIPHKLLATLMAWLEAMKLLAIWYYVLVIIGILIALGIIYLIQKKFFNKERLLQKRFIRGECIECGKFLPKHCSHCPFCGGAQRKKCSICNEETYIAGTYCKNCGKQL